MSTLIELSEVRTPTDLHFDPQKFHTFREGQLEAARRVAACEKPLALVEAPTGSGKSLMAFAAHRLMGQPRAAYLVSTKQLQDQIEHDFNVPVLKGRNNYPCLFFKKDFPEVTSEICYEYLDGDECELDGVCPYKMKKREALSAPICVLNYPLFLTEANYVERFSSLGYLIMDEVDSVEDHLMSFIQVRVTGRLIDRLKLGVPEFKTKLEAQKKWVERSALRVEEEVKKTTLPPNPTPTQIKSFIRLKRSYKKLQFLLEELDDKWVMEQEGPPGKPTSITFKPVKVESYAREYLWRHTAKTLGMSATIIGPTAMAMELGLHSWDVESFSLSSPFPVEDRLVNYIPVANVTHKSKETAYPLLSRAVSEILKKHPKEKVLVHAVSYELRNFLRDNIRPNNHDLLTHEKANRAEVLERFKKYPRPVVLISPSMERGVDLPGDLCRIIVVTKVPYPDLGSPQINKRVHSFSDGSMWYARRTARSLVQMTGRATRFQGDWSVSYILDSQFGNLVSRNGAIFPNWWRSAVRSGTL